MKIIKELKEGYTAIWDSKLQEFKSFIEGSNKLRVYIIMGPLSTEDIIGKGEILGDHLYLNTNSGTLHVSLLLRSQLQMEIEKDEASIWDPKTKGTISFKRI